ncbi:hypothetical protein BH23BAC3_BH23BAC3_28660 [soil metagenome]
MGDDKLDSVVSDLTDPGENRHPAVAVLKYSGIGLFFIGMAVFVATLSMSTYVLTDTVLVNAISNEIHLEVVRDEVEPMLGKIYTSKFNFISELDRHIKASNEQLNQDNQIYPYDRGQYRLYITKGAGTGVLEGNLMLFFWLSIGLASLGTLIYNIPKIWEHLPGIKNDHIFHNHATKGGAIGLIIGIFLIAFYIVLYWYPEYITNWIRIVDPISYAIKGTQASQWFLYGLLYTLAILVMGIRMFIKYRHSNYHLIRTGSVMFFQTAFAFLIPELLVAFNKPYFDFKNIWPLDYDFFYGYQIDTFLNAGSLGTFMLIWGVLLIIVGVPVFTYFYGKRWYCSWVCGCGGLAETLGDPYRQLSDNSVKAWKVERWMVHSVLVFVVLMTVGVLYTYATGSGTLLGLNSYNIREAYGFAIGSVFAGVIGVGFYPFMGSRVWCRFGCPLAAYLGLIQRFKSRFRITTNGGQCISCGNCSTYCEMGIDVRWYAQRGQNIVRASCVGCGVCSSVCPRGVLKLENGPEEGRFNEPKAFTIHEDGVTVHT